MDAGLHRGHGGVSKRNSSGALELKNGDTIIRCRHRISDKNNHNCGSFSVDHKRIVELVVPPE